MIKCSDRNQWFGSVSKFQENSCSFSNHVRCDDIMQDAYNRSSH